jgi:hypothetical protein
LIQIGNMSLLKTIIKFVKNYYPLLLALLIILALSPITHHQDFSILSKLAERTASGNLDLYDEIIIDQKSVGRMIMPPFVVLLDSLNFFIFKTLHLINFHFGLDFPGFKEELLLKLRYVLVFLLSYPLVRKASFAFSTDKKITDRISAIWITSPILIFFTFTQGNNDIYSTLFILAFLYFVFKDKYFEAMIFLGLAAASKNYALFLFLPMSIILSQKNLKKAVDLFLTSAVIYLVPLVFYIKNIRLFFTGGGEGLYILETVIPSRHNYFVFAILYLLLILYLIYFYKPAKRFEIKKDVVYYGLVFLSLFFIPSYFIPQWFLWILPFLIFVVYKSLKVFSLYCLLIISLLISLITNWPKCLDIDLFRPVLMDQLNYSFLSSNAFLVSSTSTIFITIFGFLLLYVYKTRNNEHEIQDLRLEKYVFLGLLPFAIYLLVMFGFGIASNRVVKNIHETTNKLKNKEYRILNEYNKDQIKEVAALQHIEIRGDSYFPSSNDPGIVVPIQHYVPTDHSKLVVIIKAKPDKNTKEKLRPQVYWSGGPGFYEVDSITLFHKLDDALYASLERNILSINNPLDAPINFIRIDPYNRQVPFTIDLIKVVEVKS